MVKGASLWSVTAELASSVIFTRQLPDDVSGTVQAYDPAEAAVLAMISAQLVPLSVEYSILILVTSLLVQVIFWGEPDSQSSPPLGAVTVTMGFNIVNTASLWSVTVPSLVSVIFTRQFVDDTAGIVQEYDPADAAVLAMISVQFVPPFVEYSSLTLVTLELVQVMFCWVLASQDSEPLGEVRVSVPGISW